MKSAPTGSERARSYLAGPHKRDGRLCSLAVAPARWRPKRSVAQRVLAKRQWRQWTLCYPMGCVRMAKFQHRRHGSRSRISTPSAMRRAAPHAPHGQPNGCKNCSYSSALNHLGRAAAPRRGPRIQALTPPQPPRTRCASHSSRTSPATRLAAATLRPFLPAPRRKPRLRVRSRMHSHDAAHRSTQVAPPLLRPPPHARRQHRQAPASNGAQFHRRPIRFAAKILVTYTSSIRMISARRQGTSILRIDLDYE